MRSLNRFFLVLAAGLGLVLGPAFPAWAQGGLDDDTVADCLYNLAQYAQWPPQDPQSAKDAPFRIGVLGSKSLEKVLQAKVEGKNLAERPIQVEVLAPSQADALRLCNILFISRPMKNRLPELLNSLKGTSALTVSDIPGFSSRGGMVELGGENGKPALKINLAEANRGGLFLSAKLLQIAEINRSVWSLDK